jgi:VIT1/CCC1 family predicted Fe2+/Mn2+ transporter
VGSAIAVLAGRGPLRGGLRMVAIATVVGAASYLVGQLIGENVTV